MRRNGFTLIELLVVVTIIALLIAILLPSLSNAVAVAKRVACGAQLRQLALATTFYVNDYRTFPTHANVVWSYTRWAGKRGAEYTEEDRLINPYLSINRKVAQEDNEGVFGVFRCPKDTGTTGGRWPVDRLPTTFDVFGNSYLYNSGANDNGPDGLHARKLSNISHPGMVILANDLAFNAYGWQVAVPGPPGVPFQRAYWHHETELGWGNVAFVDNHIEYLRATYDAPDYQNGSGWTFVYNGPK
jgi:prepilin-type N-terminal cleavage/methylation domain-containing protein